MDAPEIETERLLLRPLQRADSPVYRDFYAEATGSGNYGGPLTPTLAWKRLALDVGHWALKGYGMWAVVSGGMAR